MPYKERPIYRHSYSKKETEKEEKASTYEIVTQKIIERMEQGEIPWKKPWKAQLPRNLITNKPYRGINLLLLGSQDYSSPYWLSFKQAQEKGGHVRKGEKGSISVNGGEKMYQRGGERVSQWEIYWRGVEKAAA